MINNVTLSAQCNENDTYNLLQDEINILVSWNYCSSSCFYFEMNRSIKLEFHLVLKKKAVSAIFIYFNFN